MIRIKSDRENKKTFVQIDKMPGANYKSIRSALSEIGSQNKKHLRTLIKSKDKTGRIYGSHQASAPGEAPASLTHTLEKTVKYAVRGDFQVEFGDTQPYGYWLEHGTEDNKIAPRPHVVRTIREKQRDVREILRKHLEPKRMLR